MSAPSDDDGEKPHDPTPRKLEQARRKGEIVRSQDVTAAAAYLGFLVALLVFGPASIARLGSAGMVLLDQADLFAGLVFGGARAPVGGLLATLALGLAPWILLPALLAVAALFAQNAMLFTGENLQPRLSRISPLAQAKQKFGRGGLFEFAKSAVKLVVIAAVLAVFLIREAAAILMLAHLAPGAVAAEIGRLMAGFLGAVLAVMAVIAAIDYAWQHFEHMRRNRMSLKELRDETKESEGDPHLKSERRRRGMEIATNRMLAEVPGADVVIVNPTHFAVALKWSRAPGSAPVCVAKGADEIAARIRERAAEAGVPIHSDPPTARALFATLEPGDMVRPEHYRAVAAAIRFAERMRSVARDRRAGPGR